MWCRSALGLRMESTILVKAMRQIRHALQTAIDAWMRLSDNWHYYWPLPERDADPENSTYSEADIIRQME